MTGDSEGDARAALEAEALAQRVREARVYAGLNQEQVATALGIPRAAVSAIETGRRRVSGLELGQLASVLGVSVDRLLGHAVVADPTVDALFRATHDLSEPDKAQVLRFAEFLRSAGDAPAPPDQ